MLNEPQPAEPGTTSNDLGAAGSSQLEAGSPSSSTGSSGVAEGEGPWRFFRPPGFGVGVGVGRGRGGISTVGTPSTVRPSAWEAAAAVPRTRVSFSCTESTVVEAGTARVAVMITLAAATSIVTCDVSRPAMFAMFSCKLEVSE